MKNKKVIIALIAVCLVVAAAIAGWKMYQQGTNVVEVIPVELLNTDWGAEYEGTSGIVANSLSQSVTPDGSLEVSKIYVKAGQKVKIGDKILAYDMATQKLDLELKGYELKELEFQIKRAEEDLANLKKGIVTDGYDSDGVSTLGKKVSILGSIFLRTVDETTAKEQTTTETTAAESTTASTNAATETDSSATTESVTDATTETEIDTDATTEKEDETETTTESDKSSEVTVEDSTSDTKTTTSTKETSATTTESDDYDGGSDTITYTASEIKEMISSQEAEIAELKLQLKEEQLEYDTMKKEIDDGTVTAAVAGVVKEVNDPEDAMAAGEAVVVIVSEDKLYVKGTVDEFNYTNLTKGMTITATSWDTGNVFQATITEVSSYPVTSNSYYGVSGNPNVSYYPFTAVIEEETEGISSGESVTIAFDQNTATDGAESMYLPLAYVRTEGNISYVYISDENDRLKKQKVTTGQTLYNTVVEIKDGVSFDDYVAFPYGNQVKEGAKTEVSDDESNIVY